MRSDLAGLLPSSLAFRLTASIGIAVTVVFWLLGWGIQHMVEQGLKRQQVQELCADLTQGQADDV